MTKSDKVHFVLRQLGYSPTKQPIPLPGAEGYQIVVNFVPPNNEETVSFQYWGYADPMPEIGDLLGQFDQVAYDAAHLNGVKAKALEAIDDEAARIKAYLGTPQHIDIYPFKRQEVLNYDAGIRSELDLPFAYAEAQSEADEVGGELEVVVAQVIETYRAGMQAVESVYQINESIRVRGKKKIKASTSISDIEALLSDTMTKFAALEQQIIEGLSLR